MHTLSFTNKREKNEHGNSIKVRLHEFIGENITIINQ